jgi:hypothetical protein
MKARVEAAVLLPLGLILAFTFGAVQTRLDIRELIIKEANTIGTAYLRKSLRWKRLSGNDGRFYFVT